MDGSRGWWMLHWVGREGARGARGGRGAAAGRTQVAAAEDDAVSGVDDGLVVGQPLPVLDLGHHPRGVQPLPAGRVQGLGRRRRRDLLMHAPPPPASFAVLSVGHEHGSHVREGRRREGQRGGGGDAAHGPPGCSPLLSSSAPPRPLSYSDLAGTALRFIRLCGTHYLHL